MCDMKKSLIYLDHENIQNSLDLLGVIDLMYGKGNSVSFAVCLNHQGIEAMGLVDHIIRVQDERIENHDLINLTNAIEELQQRYAFDSILIPATHTGRMLAPRLSMRLHVGLVADVTAIEHHNGDLQMVRPAFSGKIMAGIVNRGRLPVMMSVRQNVFNYHSAETKKTSRIDFLPTNIQPSSIQLLESKEKERSLDIRDSEILISGGGGVQDNFHCLDLLANELDAQVSASRRIVDSGLASRRIQVGQSGKTVSPRLYIALGIYGSLQHIEGLNNVENIISVNIDKDAPICSLSDIVVVGDAVKFIEKLVNKIKKNRNIETGEQ
jgi:electron transfer flavoprotein alpha subunit